MSLTAFEREQLCNITTKYPARTLYLFVALRYAEASQFLAESYFEDRCLDITAINSFNRNTIMIVFTSSTIADEFLSKKTALIKDKVGYFSRSPYRHTFLAEFVNPLHRILDLTVESAYLKDIRSRGKLLGVEKRKIRGIWNSQWFIFADFALTSRERFTLKIDDINLCLLVTPFYTNRKATQKKSTGDVEVKVKAIPRDKSIDSSFAKKILFDISQSISTNNTPSKSKLASKPLTNTTSSNPTLDPALEPVPSPIKGRRKSKKKKNYMYRDENEIGDEFKIVDDQSFADYELDSSGYDDDSIPTLNSSNKTPANSASSKTNFKMKSKTTSKKKKG